MLSIAPRHWEKHVRRIQIPRLSEICSTFLLVDSGDVPSATPRVSVSLECRGQAKTGRAVSVVRRSGSSSEVQSTVEDGPGTGFANEALIFKPRGLQKPPANLDFSSHKISCGDGNDSAVVSA